MKIVFEIDFVKYDIVSKENKMNTQKMSKNRQKHLIFIFFLIILLFSCKGEIFTIEQINYNLKNTRHKKTTERIEIFSQLFLNLPYKGDPLGEGTGACFDEDPVYRFDSFDCTTFIETVLALSLSKDMISFKKNILKIRYKNSTISFQTRNHFTSLDWIPNLIKLKIGRDISETFSGYKIAKAKIDKANWLSCPQRKIDRIQTKQHNYGKKKRLYELQSIGQGMIKSGYKPEESQISYVPLEKLLKHPLILQKIPSGSIISLVTPNRDIRKFICSYINVSHQGFAIHKNGSIFFRHASSKSNKVTDQILYKYLHKLSKKTFIKGINIIKVIDDQF